MTKLLHHFKHHVRHFLDITLFNFYITFIFVCAIIIILFGGYHPLSKDNFWIMFDTSLFATLSLKPIEYYVHLLCPFPFLLRSPFFFFHSIPLWFSPWCSHLHDLFFPSSSIYFYFSPHFPPKGIYTASLFVMGQNQFLNSWLPSDSLVFGVWKI